MQQETLWLVLAIAAVVVAVSFAIMAWALWRLAGDTRQTARAGRELMVSLQEELPATITTLERASASLEQLAGEGAARLVVADRLAEEAELTMIAVRDLSRSVHEIVRGPADTVTGVKRSARMVTDSVASGADRIRRRITGDQEEPPAG
ncbi:MAG: hypothetical protein ABWZ82_00960 [Candidatus Limnocylindrales bacterium]